MVIMELSDDLIKAIRLAYKLAVPAKPTAVLRMQTRGTAPDHAWLH